MNDFDVFISYSRKDTARVAPIVQFLTDNGIKVWIDKDGIETGDAFKTVIVSAIIRSSIFLYFSSEASNASEWTVKEVNTAIYKKKRIIPVKLDNSEYSPSVLFDLVGLDYIDFTNEKQEAVIKERLLRTVEKENGKPTIATPKPQSIPESSLQKANNVSSNRHIVRKVWVYGTFAFHVVVTIFTCLCAFAYPALTIVIACLVCGTYGMWLEIKQRPHSYAITASGDIIAAVANCIFCGGWTEINVGTLIIMGICMGVHWCFLNTSINRSK